MNFSLPDHTILLTVGGSRAYGIHTETSDVDVKGVAIPPLEYFFGFLQRFEQADKPDHMRPFIPFMNEEEQAAIAREKIEGVVFGLVKFMGLATDANPNILDVLFCRDSEVRICTEMGAALRANRDLFVTGKCKHTFSGYAMAQLKRIRGHKSWLLNPPKRQPTREDFGLKEQPLIDGNQQAAINAAVAKILDEWELDLTGVDEPEKIRIKGDVRTFLDEFAKNLPEGLGVLGAEDAKWLSALRSLGADDNLVYIMQQERAYRNAHQHWKQYLDWQKGRNPARAALEEKYGYDTKHGAHLVRLLRMGKEILLTGKVNVWRGDIDREELLAIRNHGAWSYDQLVEWADAEDAEITKIYQERKYVVPLAPDRVALDTLCAGLVNQAMSKGIR